MSKLVLKSWKILTSPNSNRLPTFLVSSIRKTFCWQLFTVSQPQHPMALRVGNLVRPKTFTLNGGLPINLFRGDRNLTLIPQPDGTTEFSMCEVFSGLLEPLPVRRIPDFT